MRPADVLQISVQTLKVLLGQYLLLGTLRKDEDKDDDHENVIWK